MATHKTQKNNLTYRPTADHAASFSNLKELITKLVGEETGAPDNITSLTRSLQARLLEQAVQIIRPALSLLVFRPPVELKVEDSTGSDMSGRHQSEWDLKCLILGPKFLTGQSDESSRGLSADLVLGEDGDLYALDWTGNCVITPQGTISYRASVRHYKTFEEAFNDGWGPVEHYIQQIENRLDAAVQAQSK